MGMLFGLIVFIVFIILFFKYPKQILILCGVLIVLIILLWQSLVTIPQQKREDLENKVKVSILYVITNCGPDFPLQVSINNNSNKIVNKVYWRVVINKPGFSSDLSGYDNEFSSDKILKPGESWISCYKLPRTLKPEGLPLNQLEYKIEQKNVVFE